MSFPGDLPSSSANPPGGDVTFLGGADPTVPLLNLSSVHNRMDVLQKFLSDSINSNTLISKDRMDMVSAEISSAIQQIIVNGAALLACAETANLSGGEVRPANFQSGSAGMTGSEDKVLDTKSELIEDEDGDDCEIIELDSVELLAEHIHFCDICGKGFKRDANLRMHMRAHGNQYKTPEALAKPEKLIESENGIRRTRFSCPFVGCNRNKQHKKFRPLKSVICVKNHFKRSHCPKMHSCDKCKKNFAVVADLKSHLKHCGETKWKCSCGTNFSRKDKLFGHMALFEGHMPAVLDEEDGEQGKGATAVKKMELETGSSSNGFFDGLIDDGFGSIDNYCFQDLLGSSPNLSNNDGLDIEMDGFFNF